MHEQKHYDGHQKWPILRKIYSYDTYWKCVDTPFKFNEFTFYVFASPLLPEYLTDPRITAECWLPLSTLRLLSIRRCFSLPMKHFLSSPRDFEANWKVSAWPGRRIRFFELLVKESSLLLPSVPSKVNQTLCMEPALEKKNSEWSLRVRKTIKEIHNAKFISQYLQMALL